MRYSQSPKNSIATQGFTLIELLVAISILAIVAVLGWRGLDSIVRSREVLTAELEQTRGLQLTFAQLQSDCTNNVNPANYPNLPEGLSSWIEPQRFILIRNVFPDAQAPAMQVVTYRLHDGNLTRFESISTRDLSMLKQLLQQARTPPDQQVEVIMQKNVQNIEFVAWPIGSGNAVAATSNNVVAPSASSSLGASATSSSVGTSGNQAVNNGIQNGVPTNTTTGLQVSLQLEKHDKNMLKIFILGGA